MLLNVFFRASSGLGWLGEKQAKHINRDEAADRKAGLNQTEQPAVLLHEPLLAANRERDANRKTHGKGKGKWQHGNNGQQAGRCAADDAGLCQRQLTRDQGR
jgi:hypothetical protein